MIKDSGERRKFETGAVRDIQEGKGRCDLLPLKEVSLFLGSRVLFAIAQGHIISAIAFFCEERGWTKEQCILEVSKHYEEGLKKYGPRNWEKGINTSSFIDSGVRHYIKWLDEWLDEPHDRAFIWNMLGYLWTKENHPELDDYPKAEDRQ